MLAKCHKDTVNTVIWFSLTTAVR